MNVKDACLKKNTVRRKRMHVRPVKPVIENDSEKELQQQNANEMHQTMKNCKKADKTESRSAKGPQTAEKAESEKRGLFHSPIFHITCIIRNACNPKNQVSSLFHFRVRRPVCECIVWNRIVLPVHLFLFNSGKVRPAVQTAAVCQSIHRLPHNKCVPLFYSLLRCRTVLHRLHLLQSTVLPIQPDSLRLLTM